MKINKRLVSTALLLCLATFDSPGQTGPAGKTAPAVEAPALDSTARADKRYEEMLGKMQNAIEEIAELYGNPLFVQVFTNDPERASDLKERLRSAQSSDDVRRELSSLQKKRDDLLNDIALKEREAARLTGRLVRERAALDALSDAFEQARKAVEETAK